MSIFAFLFLPLLYNSLFKMPQDVLGGILVPPKRKYAVGPELAVGNLEITT